MLILGHPPPPFFGVFVSELITATPLPLLTMACGDDQVRVTTMMVTVVAVMMMGEDDDSVGGVIWVCWWSMIGVR